METLPARVDLDEIQSLAQLMINSKMFTDIQGVAQGAVRILAGRELGIGPVASLRSIEIVRGNLSIRSHLMAAMIKRSPRYNYRVRVSTDDKCIIDFIEDGEVCGTSEFTMEDAKQADLLTSSSGKVNEAWKKYPKTMLYNRAMSQGARMYCPDIFLGGVFYESEIIEAEALPVSEEPIAEVILDGGRMEGSIEPPKEKQMGLIYGLLKQYGVKDGDKRELISLAYKDDLSKGEATHLIDKIKRDEELTPRLKGYYVELLIKKYGHSKKLVLEHMDTTYGHRDYSKLNNAQFISLVEHLSGDDIPEVDNNDVYSPGEPLKEVTLDEWVQLSLKKCTECQITAKQFEQWAISQFGNGTVTELPHLPKEAYYALTAMDADSIKSQVTAFHTEDDKQAALVS